MATIPAKKMVTPTHNTTPRSISMLIGQQLWAFMKKSQSFVFPTVFEKWGKGKLIREGHEVSQ